MISRHRMQTVYEAGGLHRDKIHRIKIFLKGRHQEVRTGLTQLSAGAVRPHNLNIVDTRVKLELKRMMSRTFQFPSFWELVMQLTLEHPTHVTYFCRITFANE